jgi:hypothetical protein
MSLLDDFLHFRGGIHEQMSHAGEETILLLKRAGFKCPFWTIFCISGAEFSNRCGI